MSMQLSSPPPPPPSSPCLQPITKKHRNLPWIIGESDASKQSPPISSRVLRPRHNAPAPPALELPKSTSSKISKSSKPARRRRRRRSSTPPILPEPSSPPVASSPYIFDDDFYNNRSINNEFGVDIKAATYGAQTNRQMKWMREIHETIIDNAQIQGGFIPLDIPFRSLEATLLESVTFEDPASYFELFFTDLQFERFATNTNKYAAWWHEQHPNQRFWRFHPTTATECKVYVAVLIFLGAARNRNIYSNWISPVRNSPCIKLKWRRYQQFAKFFKVSDLEVDQQIEPQDWHCKLSPLDTDLQETFQGVVIPGSQISYDEMMIPFRGNSIHLTKVPGKPDPNGFKLWTVGEKGYVYDWLYYSGRFSK